MTLSTLWRRIAASLFLLALAACQSGTPHYAPGAVKLGKPYAVDGVTYYPASDPSYDKIGIASWYGPGFHGKYTASGEVFDQNALTAAHPTLPMPSIVRVTNLQNGKSVIVRINDRGPFKDNRIIDLSKKSAHVLGISSTAEVRVQYLKQQTDAYLASVRNGHPITMAELNEEARHSQIVEADDASTHAGQVVDSAAPVMTVGEDNLQTASNAAAPVHHHHFRLIRDARADDDVSRPPLPESTRSDASDTASPKVDLFERVAAPAPVQVTAEDPPPAPKKAAAAPAQGEYVVQAGAFSAEAHARKLSDRLSSIADPSVDKVEVSGKTWWRVRLGPFAQKQQAQVALDKVHDAGIKDAHLIRL